MTTPSLAFKSGNSNLVFNKKDCTAWPRSNTKVQASDTGTFLTGVYISPYDIRPTTEDCLGSRFAYIRDLYYRNISSPKTDLIKKFFNIGQDIRSENLKNVKTGRLSGGDIAESNVFFNNILSPSVANKYYGINGMKFYSNIGQYCINNTCQPTQIHYILRNIYNPRDVIRQVTYEQAWIAVTGPGLYPPFNEQINHALINDIVQNPEDVITDVYWNYEDQGFLEGIGSIVQASGKTIEMRGITDSNIRSLNKDNLFKFIYERQCLDWTMTKYNVVNGVPQAEFPPINIRLIKQTRPAENIIYSDYYEGTSTTKRVEYYDVIKFFNEEQYKLGEIYAVIDISISPAQINLWFSYWDDMEKKADYDPMTKRILETGFRSTENSLATITNISRFFPDMKIRLGTLPSNDILNKFYGINLNSDIKTLDSKNPNLYFVAVGGDFDKPLSLANPYSVKDRYLMMFTPKCNNLEICVTGSDCANFNKRLCLEGKCVDCTSSDINSCPVGNNCVENKCIAPITCTTDITCSSNTLVPYCNTSLNKCVQCNTSSQCGENKFCNPLKGYICETKTDECLDDTDCQTNQKCIEGVCITNPLKISNTVLISIGVVVVIIVLFFIIRAFLLKKK